MRKTRVTDTRNSFVFDIWMKQDLNNYTFLLLYLMGERSGLRWKRPVQLAGWEGEEVGNGCTGRREKWTAR